jgi:hypothetical protein
MPFSLIAATAAEYWPASLHCGNAGLFSLIEAGLSPARMAASLAAPDPALPRVRSSHSIYREPLRPPPMHYGPAN